jgi:tyrosyl-tRNA synthetase
MTQGAKSKRMHEMTEQRFKPVEEQLAYIKKGVAEIIPESELAAKLEASRKTGKPMRVYLGVDPTAPDLHLGHTVVLRKLKHFQDLGHTAVFLIGDFSAMIGDPTGVSETRPPLSRAQVDANAKTYLEQVFKILDREKTEVRYNSEWLGKLTSYEIIRLTAKYSLPRMLERDDFKQRLSGELKARIFRSSEEAPGSRESEEAAFKLPSSGKASPVKRPPSMAIHELLYPLLTALDAVELQSDVELGATEQKFNLLVHREIQREYGLPGQAILTMPILVGLDGQRKMSKSLGNYVGITEPPSEMFGKLMSIPDDLMWSYYELLTDRAPKEIATLQKEVATGKLHPMDAKMRLAEEVISDFHGKEAARKASEQFQRVFRDRQAPTEMQEMRLRRRPDGFLETRTTDAALQVISPSPKWPQLLKYLSQAESISEAARIVEQGGLEINGNLLRDPMARLDTSVDGSYQVRLGKKKFLRIIVE